MTSRFGAYVGRWDGSGLEGLDAFPRRGRLLEDHEARVRLGREGRAWVRSTHTRDRFLERSPDWPTRWRAMPTKSVVERRVPRPALSQQ